MLQYSVRTRFVLAFLFALAVVAVATLERANAVTEYCPATLENSEHLGGGLYSFVLSAASARTVQGTLLVDTNDGWYTIDFPSTKLVAFQEHLHSPNTRWEREVYVSQTLYARFPPSVNGTENWSVLAAQSTGDTVFHWDAQGLMTCKPAESVYHATYSTARSNVVSENPMPFDLTQQPSASDVVIPAKPATFEPKQTCETASEAAVATHKYVPPWPAGIPQPYQGVTIRVVVAVSHDGAPDDEWLYQPSGVKAFDDMAVFGAEHSTYRAARKFCEPAPGYYLYVITFAGKVR